MFWKIGAQRRARTIDELYGDTSLYHSSQRLLPPSETRPHVLRFELTQGCSWGRCTYCNGFDGHGYSAKSTSEFQLHVDTVIARVGTSTRLAQSFSRVFIGGGNALSVETVALADAIQIARSGFARFENFRDKPRRTAMYGRTADFIRHDADGLTHLAEAGLSLVYWGVESGHNPILKLCGKGDSKMRILAAAEIAQRVGMRPSVMIMPGLGGIRHSEGHIRDTADVLSAIEPAYITFLGVNAPGTAYDKRMKAELREGLNRPLTRRETALQMIDIIAQTDFRRETRVGCFSETVDKVGENSLPFGSVLISCSRTHREVVSSLRALADIANPD